MTHTIAIIDYGSGNLASAKKAFARVIADHGLDMRVVVTGRADDIAAADRLVLPGQGAFGDCMESLSSIEGMIEALSEGVHKHAKPFFGICVGMQLLATRGLEHGIHAGLDWIPGEVVPMTPADPALKIPHMGWNTVRCTSLNSQDNYHPVLQGIINNDESGTHFYFVHSFMMQCYEARHALAVCDYGGPINAIVGRDNILGVQFHPEKSQQAGCDLIAGFLHWKP
jgi:imidazole glycerol-phosphate synthase subunit HisH